MMLLLDRLITLPLLLLRPLETTLFNLLKRLRFLPKISVVRFVRRVTLARISIKRMQAQKLGINAGWGTAAERPVRLNSEVLELRC
ncbi:P44 outermembrane protein, silent [Anaplasma phagocytophilum]|uniref:p44 outermembrane protein, silent n=1 Tax=Anaplasma phagocytophilum TaxID=948 RepID=A0A098GJB4_ANAPH|nr:P44 outermembrane protein, silent [Anaplasma phagocytophilum]